MLINHKWAVLTLLPVLAVIAAIALVYVVQQERLAEEQKAMVENTLIESKRLELLNYVELARTSIDHLYGSGANDEETKEKVKAILRKMTFGDDGYFFVYDLEGKNLVHPRIPKLEGQNLWDMRDANGFPVIQRLLEAAQRGGGFERYLWEKPSNSKPTDKLSYVTLLKPWGWMYGTGIYLDDVAEAKAKISQESETRIHATMLTLVGAAIIAVLIVFASGVALNISDQRLADAKLTAMARRVVTSQEEERTRVARELHDGISQQLVSAKFQIEHALFRLSNVNGDEAATRGFEKSIEILDDAMAEIRRISHNLRSSLLDNLGLAAALGQLANDFSAQTGVAVDVHVSECPAVLPRSPAIALFRIAQEALTNVAKHAHATQVTLRLKADGQNVRLVVIDNGKGFDIHKTLQSHRTGIGLRNIRERAELEEGSMQITSRPGYTELLVTLPLTV